MLLNKAMINDSAASLTSVADILHVSSSLLGMQQYSTQNAIAEILDSLAGAIGHTLPFLPASSSEPLDQLDYMCHFFVEAIKASPQGKFMLALGERAELYAAQDMKNAWLGRWMSLTASTAFQFHPYLQAPAMLVLGHLIDAPMEDELLFQVRDLLFDKYG